MTNERFIRLDDFDIYQLAMEIGECVWKWVENWRPIAQNTVGEQVIRSADSIAANIAEGYGRFTYKERKRYCYFSRGSLLETKTWIKKARNRNLISDAEFNEISPKMQNLHKMLNSYIKTLRQKEKSTNDEY